MFEYKRAKDFVTGQYVSPSGETVDHVFRFNEKHELVDTGKTVDIQKQIDSYLDDVLIEKIVQRSLMTGESFEASPEMFGDATKIPKSLLELQQEGQKVQNFVDGLSDSDLSRLNEVGFDSFMKEKIEARAAELAAQKAAKSEGGVKDE